jgi:hypothetical protein
MYPEIRNKAIQSSKVLRAQMLVIMSFIINEMYPFVRNKTTELFNNPKTRVTLIFGLFILLIIFYGSGNDFGG